MRLYIGGKSASLTPHKIGMGRTQIPRLLRSPCSFDERFFLLKIYLKIKDLGAIELSFEILGEIRDIETIAIGRSIRELERLQKAYGSGRWRKLKGIATIQLEDRTVCEAEIHWYEAHGIGKKEIKIKYFLG